jgi:hypothetical protein
VFKRIAVDFARVLPNRVKQWIHKHRLIDNVARRMYGAATSGEPVAVEDGPLRGYRLSPGEHVSHAHIRGTYERDVQEAIARLVRSGDVCLDIGASIG